MLADSTLARVGAGVGPVSIMISATLAVYFLARILSFLKFIRLGVKIFHYRVARLPLGIPSSFLTLSGNTSPILSALLHTGALSCGAPQTSIPTQLDSDMALVCAVQA